MYDGEIECDSDGDPRMTFIPVQREKKIEEEVVEVVENPPLPSEDQCVYDRDAMKAYDDKGKSVETRGIKMLLVVFLLLILLLSEPIQRRDFLLPFVLITGLAAGFDVRVKALAYAMRILRSQPTTNPYRPSPSSSNSSVVSTRGRPLPPNVYVYRQSSSSCF